MKKSTFLFIYIMYSIISHITKYILMSNESFSILFTGMLILMQLEKNGEK